METIKYSRILRSTAVGTLFRHRYGLVCGLMLLLSMPARFANVQQSLWLDEAWVANSLLAPTLRETVYFDR